MATEFKIELAKNFPEDWKFFGSHLAHLKNPMVVMTDEGWQPPTDVIETQEHFHIIVDIAGIDPNNISLVYKNGHVTIKGIRGESSSGLNIITYHKKEIDTGYFERKIKVSARIDKENIKATYEDGFLHIVLNKDVPTQDHKVEIPIK